MFEGDGRGGGISSQGWDFSRGAKPPGGLIAQRGRRPLIVNFEARCSLVRSLGSRFAQYELVIVCGGDAVEKERAGESGCS